MKPDWDTLGKEYAGHPSVLIGDVDCTTDEGKEVCNANEVRGYPTIKYFTAETGEAGEAYQGGRSLKALQDFVKVCDLPASPASFGYPPRSLLSQNSLAPSCRSSAHLSLSLVHRTSLSPSAAPRTARAATRRRWLTSRR